MNSEPKVEKSSVAHRCRRRIMRRLLPYLFLLYIIAYLDRVNVGFAALQMRADLSFDDQVIGFGAGIFFVGYFLLEIPGCIIVEKWSARRWIARIMVSWGIVAVLMGFVQTKTQFYSLRFLLGAAEAGFFPGIIVYLSHWFRHQDRAKVVAMFMAAQPIAIIFGAPLSGLLLDVKWLGLSGWRWLFIIEGLPAIVFGLVTIFYLTDRPHQAGWLPVDERDWLTAELEHEAQAKQREHSPSILQAFRQREVILLTLAFFCIVTAAYGFTFWLPTIIKRASGSSNLVVSLLSAIPYFAGLAAILVVSVGLLFGVVAQQHIVLAMVMFSVGVVGLYGYLPGFWALPTSFLTGTAAAASIGLINSVGNLGGWVGPWLVGYLSKATGSFVSGALCLSLSAMIAAGLVLTMRATKKSAVL